MNNLIKIKWKELKIGDKFPDGSVVTDIKPWDNMKCYELELENGSKIVSSYTHLFKTIIKDGNNVLNNNFDLSEASRIQANVLKDENYNSWVCSEDIFECFENGYDVYINDIKLKSIKLYKNGEKQRVRCITTNTGVYEIGGFLSHNCGTSEVSAQQNYSKVLMNTFDGYGTSPIIQKMKEAETTEEMRQILYEGLKEQYKNAGLKQDDFNIMMIARKLTSYKRVEGGLEPIKEGEKCSIVSSEAVGSYGNIFKVSELKSGYKYLTRPHKEKIKTDASNQILL